MGRIGVLMIVFLFVATLPALPVAAAPTLLPDRESTYPEGIENITHSPWEVRRGQDVQVTVTLNGNATEPDRVRLLVCRVEPDYVCGLPEAMQQTDDRVWMVTINGAYGDNELIKPDTRHIGYNVTLMYNHENEANGPVYAPTGNHWVPSSFPTEIGGNYYFLNLGDTNESPAIVIFPLLLVLVALTALARNGHRGGTGNG